MLSVGISAWISALNNKDLKLCKEVQYEADAEEKARATARVPSLSTAFAGRFEGTTATFSGSAVGWPERCMDNCNHPHGLPLRGTHVQCSRRDQKVSYALYISREKRERKRERILADEVASTKAVVMAGAGDPYRNRLNFGVTLDKTHDGFSCELLVEALTAANIILAPELLEADALEGVELMALCGIIEDPTSGIEHLAKTSKVGRRDNRLIESI